MALHIHITCFSLSVIFYNFAMNGGTRKSLSENGCLMSVKHQKRLHYSKLSFLSYNIRDMYVVVLF